MPFSVEAATAGIKEYCEQDFTLDPEASSDDEFQQDVPEGVSTYNFVDDGANLRIKMGATFAADQSKCVGKPAKFSTKGDECIRKLTGIVNGCDTQTTTRKIGGVLLDNTAHGCVEWSIFGSCTSNTDCVTI